MEWKKFKKIPAIVEAYQWFKIMGETEGVVRNPIDNPMTPDFYYCKTAHGNVEIWDGDWIVKEGGKYYPVKQDIFKRLYEEID